MRPFCRCIDDTSGRLTCVIVHHNDREIEQVVRDLLIEAFQELLQLPGPLKCTDRDRRFGPGRLDCRNTIRFSNALTLIADDVYRTYRRSRRSTSNSVSVIRLPGFEILNTLTHENWCGSAKSLPQPLCDRAVGVAATALKMRGEFPTSFQAQFTQTAIQSRSAVVRS